MMQVTGMAELQRKLKTLEKSAARKAIRNAIRAGTAVMLRAVKASTPRDEGVLRKMMTSKTVGRGPSLAGIVGADVKKLQADEKRPSNIDHLVEYGHKAPDGSFVPPSGFMQRAAAEAMPRAQARMEEVLAKQIDREATK